MLLVGGEAFGWRPWDAGMKTKGGKRLLNERGQWEVEEGAWGLLEIVWPKPGGWCLSISVLFFCQYLDNSGIIDFYGCCS